MQRKDLIDLTEKLLYFKDLLIRSFMLKKFPASNKNPDIYFHDFIEYLDENALSITPELNISNKSDAVLFSELILNHEIKIKATKDMLEVMKEVMRESRNGHLYLILTEDVPLHYLSMLDSLTWVNMLIDWGADVNIPNRWRSIPTALHSAVFSRQADCIQVLIDSNADIDFLSSDHRTPMDKAVLENSEDAVRILLNNGANIGKMQKRKEPQLIKASIQKLLNEARQCTLKDLKPAIVDKINESTFFKIPDVIVELICSYEPRCSRQGYFKITKNNKEEQLFFAKDKKECKIK